MIRTALGITIAGVVACGSAIAAPLGGGLSVPVVNATAAPASVYVDSASRGGPCSDARPADGNTAARPWCTLPRAFAAAPAGSTVYVRAGKYPFVNVGAFAPAKTVTFAPYPGETPVISGMTVGVAGTTSGNFAITGLKVTNPGISLTNFTNVQLIGDELAMVPRPPGACGATSCVSNTPDAVLLTPPASNLTIDNNYVHDGSMGVAFRLGTPPRSPGHPAPNSFQNISIDNNTFSRMGDVVISVQNFEGVDISGNTFADDHLRGDVDPKCHCDAVHAIGGGDNLMLAGNLAYGGRGFLIQPSYSTGANCTPLCLTMTNTVVQNNVLVGRDFGLRVLSAPGIKVLNNTIEGPAGPDLGLSFLHGIPATTGAVVANNLISHFESAANVTFATADYNDTSQRQVGPGWDTPRGAHDISGAPRFVDPRAPAWNFSLTSESLGFNSGSRAYAPAVDVRGWRVRNPVSMGAYGAESPPSSTAAAVRADVARVCAVSSRGRAAVSRSGGSVTIRTGLAVSSGPGRSCHVQISVSLPGTRLGSAEPGRPTRRPLSGSVRRTVAAGQTRLLELRLSQRTFTRMLRRRGATLRVRITLTDSAVARRPYTLLLHPRALKRQPSPAGYGAGVPAVSSLKLSMVIDSSTAPYGLS